MRTRFVIGPVLIAAVLGMIFADHSVLEPHRPIVPGVIALLAAVGWFEFARMTGIAPGGDRADRAFFVLGLVGVLYFHLIAWLDASPSLDVDHVAVVESSFEELALGGVAGTVFAAFAITVFRRDWARHERSAFETVVAVLLLGLLFSYHTRMYLGLQEGLVIVLVYFVGIKGTDVAAYLLGSTLGRHRFIAVSPNKTVEGCLGALAWGGLCFGLAGAFREETFFPWWVGLLFGFVLGAVATVGDLTISLLKRTYGVKDTGVLVPEFGGVLDLVDSLLFTGCVFWYLVG